MKLEILRIDEINIRLHTNLIFNYLQKSPLYNPTRTLKKVESSLKKKMSKADSYSMILAQDKDEELLGQLLVRIDFGDIGLIQAWQPYVHYGANQDKIALDLIEYSKRIIKIHRKSKIEIWMELKNDQVKSMFSSYKEWYEQCGFQLTSDEFNMETTKTKLKSIEYSIPEGIDVFSMIDIPLEKLHNAVFESFKDSKDQWVKNQTEDEIKSIIQSWMKVQESFHPKASIVFIEDGNIIGFNGMEVQEDSVEVGPLGVIPSHRGKGFGRMLILESVKRLEHDNTKPIILSVSTKNIPAFTLYSDLGFKTQYETLIYSWVPKKEMKDD